MPLNQKQGEILRTVVERFLRLKSATSRRQLAVKFRALEELDDLARKGLIEQRDDRCLPTAAGFYYCGDADFARMARASAVLLLRTLQNLYEVEQDKEDFTAEEVEAHARKIHDLIEDETFKLGLYLVQHLGVLSSWGRQNDGFEPTTLRIHESVLQIDDFEAYYERRVQLWNPERTERVLAEAQRGPVRQLPQSAPAGAEPNWTQLHADVVAVAHGLFRDGHYADAVLASLRHLNSRVQALVKDRTGKELDGAPLMQFAFSVDKPVIRLAESSPLARDIQQGYMMTFAGAMIGIRNPKAHANINIDALRATHFLYMVSLLMFKLDEALAMEANAAVEMAAGKNTAL